MTQAAKIGIPKNLFTLSIYTTVFFLYLVSPTDSYQLNKSSQAVWDPKWDNHARILTETSGAPSTPESFTDLSNNNNNVKTYLSSATEAYKETFSGIKTHEFLIYYQQGGELFYFVDFNFYLGFFLFSGLFFIFDF